MSFENAIARLKGAGHTNQVKCVSGVYEPGDLVYHFSKDLGSSYEEGFIIYREGHVIAVAFLEAVYANKRNNLFQPMPASWHG
ncbi:hypothetical protein [Nitrosococcus wardiae]|uniref:Uncharacterized protein n=1 Tax=Nitrosococcus wardiae TaxID=1814290 RepID=A0A4P7C370_9GAMM|nr:hypothetical protein [Nitrosococcus wardiae]QBQ56004.1 hypothetical protein E3U44_16920 [Nitrosococcus wardiae]